MEYRCFEEIILEKEFATKRQFWFGFILDCKTPKVALKAKLLLDKNDNYLTQLNHNASKLTVLDIKGFESWADGFMGNDKSKRYHEPLYLHDLISILHTHKDFSENYTIEFLSGRCVGYPHEILITSKKRIRELKQEAKEIDEFIDQLF